MAADYFIYIFLYFYQAFSYVILYFIKPFCFLKSILLQEVSLCWAKLSKKRKKERKAMMVQCASGLSSSSLCCNQQLCHLEAPYHLFTMPCDQSDDNLNPILSPVHAPPTPLHPVGLNTPSHMPSRHNAFVCEVWVWGRTCLRGHNLSVRAATVV